MTNQDSLVRSIANRRKGRRLKWVAIILFIVVVGSGLFLRFWPPFGGAISGERLERVQASPNYRDGEFVNLMPHRPLEFGGVWAYFKEQFFGDQLRVPPSTIPVLALPPTLLKAQPALELRAIWFGHSSVYIELDGLRFFTDPVFSDYASPIDGVGPKRSHPPPIGLTDLPRIDVVLISHDHYDHLERQSGTPHAEFDCPGTRECTDISDAGDFWCLRRGVGALVRTAGARDGRLRGPLFELRSPVERDVACTTARR